MIPKILIALLTLCAGLQAQVTVANGASFRTEQPVAAGSWAVALGDFSGVATLTAQTLPISKMLGGVTVTVDSVEAPVYYVSATQVNFLIPAAATAGLKTVQVSFPGGSLSGSVRVSNAGPGLFVDFTDTGSPISGRIINAEQGIGNVVNSQATPAIRGEIVSIYGTGPGALNRAVDDGAAPGVPSATTVSEPQVFVGGVEVPVSFSGLNADAPGLWQINVTIPSDLPITGRVPLVVYSDGVDSNEVSIFVQ